MNTLVECLVFLLVSERCVSEFTAFENGMLSSSIEKKVLTFDKNSSTGRFFFVNRTGLVLESQLHFP